MDCIYCGGPVDDPFWDEICPECSHEILHEGHCFDPNCPYCVSDADDRYEQGYEQLPDVAEVGWARAL